MDLERKIDELIQNIILLQGKTEQRQKSFDLVASQANQALSEAGKKLNESATDIRQVTRHTVEQAINQPVDRLNERIKGCFQKIEIHHVGYVGCFWSIYYYFSYCGFPDYTKYRETIRTCRMD